MGKLMDKHLADAKKYIEAEAKKDDLKQYIGDTEAEDDLLLEALIDSFPIRLGGEAEEAIDYLIEADVLKGDSFDIIEALATEPFDELRTWFRQTYANE